MRRDRRAGERVVPVVVARRTHTLRGDPGDCRDERKVSLLGAQIKYRLLAGCASPVSWLIQSQLQFYPTSILPARPSHRPRGRR
eukprot:5304591-Prymnesium_polylepis.1